MLNITLNKQESIAILEPQGQLTKDDFSLVAKTIDPYISEYGSLKAIIIYTKDFPYWENFSALIKHMKFINKHHKKVSYVVFVTDSIIAEFAQHIGSHFVQAKVKTFPFNQLTKAKEWILKGDIHGINIGIQRINNNFFLNFKALGTLTHEDYEKITPLIDSALQGIDEPHIKVFVDLSEFDGWELHAAWDDFKIGLKYNFDFDKIAIYGSKNWLSYGIKVSSWFMRGQIKEFDNINEAMRWLELIK